MKKIFTSISLAALSFLAATPMSAQQQVTAEQAGAFVEAVVPVMLDQVKTISGLDVRALAAGNEEAGLLSLTQGSSISFKPDSARVNVGTIMTGLGVELPDAVKPMVGSLLNDMLFTFGDYKDVNLDGFGLKVTMPGEIKTESALGSIQILIATETMQNSQVGIPFSKISVDLKLSSQLELLLGGLASKFPLCQYIKSGNLLTLKQTQDQGVTTVQTDLGTILMLLNGGKVVSRIKITDMTGRATEDNYYTVVEKEVYADGNVLIDEKQTIYNPTQMMPLVADKIIHEIYDGGKVVGTSMETIETESNNQGQNKGQIVKTVTTYGQADEEWIPMEIEKTIMQANSPLNHQNITMSVIASIMQDVAMGTDQESSFVMTRSRAEVNKDENGEYVADEYEDEMAVAVAINKGKSVANQDSLTSAITIIADLGDLFGSDDDEAEDDAEVIDETEGPSEVCTIITGITGTNGKAVVTTPFETENGESIRVPISTFYFQTNLLQLNSATANEAIAPVSDVTINVAENGIYVNNCEKGRYSIVSINGKVVANGIISGEGAFIATPGLQRGQVYIIAVEENGAVKAIKFVK